ncbi:hypothetical protein OC25_12845 [Pedobacter kyungheensis]|uniref:Uncharacterized protein n=1 Tax=Pedobacter kyungheensis TaxID=1069985 RepID=A0A0C1D7T8_9SPHI|nr:hypothetical protein OC25_12845 [Pedobacter kyungheensis]
MKETLAIRSLFLFIKGLQQIINQVYYYVFLGLRQPVPIHREAIIDRPNDMIVISTGASRFSPVVERRNLFRQI